MNIPLNQHKEQVEMKYALKFKLEDIRHKHVMEELEFMAKHKIKHFDRRGGEI